MTDQELRELKKYLEGINWGIDYGLDYGSAKIQIREGKGTLLTVEETMRLD